LRISKSIVLLFLLLSYLPVLAQVEEALVIRYDNPGDWRDIATGLTVDGNGNIYVTGWTGTIKYSADGESLWFNHHEGHELAVDKANNFYMTGGFGTIKYFSNGDSLRFGLFGLYWGYALVLDESANVYVAGTRPTETFYDFTTIRYSPSGDTIWVRYYNGPSNLHRDVATNITIDKSGNIYVSGVSHDTGYNNSEFVTIKYTSNGDSLWVRHYNGSVIGRDAPRALVIDNSGNIYVAGESHSDGTLSDYATIKYSPNGDTLWVRRYNGPADSNDVANAIGVDDSSNVYVTGVSRGIGLASDDIATIKYSPDGDELWVRRYDGPNGWDGGQDMAIDKSGNVYITGYSRSGTLEDYITIKYAPNGDVLWQMRYNGPVDSNDVANAIAIDDSGNLYVTGRSIGSHTIQDYDYATIKYVQYNCLAKPADANGDGQVLFSDIVTIIDFLFKGQPALNPVCRGDANKDGAVLLSDIVYLINFIFKSGPAPSKNKECCL